MPDFTIITGVPYDSAEVTHSAMMPKILCVIEGDKAYVYKNRQLIRKFLHVENGLLKLNKLFKRETDKAIKMYRSVAKDSVIYIKKQSKIKVEKKQEQDKVGFDYVI